MGKTFFFNIFDLFNVILLKKLVVYMCLQSFGLNLSMKKVMFSILTLLFSFAGFAQNYQTQSVFIYSFTRYIQWPEGRNTGDFEILVLGDSPLLPELQLMAEKKKVGGDRPIKVSKISSPQEFKKCHILFIPADKSSFLPEVLVKAADQSILIVTEQPGMGLKGSTINFVQREGKMAFEMNQASMNSRKLKAAIELSRLAIII